MEPTNQNFVARYLTYLEKVRQNDPKSVDLRRCHLRRLLIWAGETTLSQAQEIEPLFPVYLAGSKNEHTHTPLTPRFMRDCCISVRTFFTWLKRVEPEQFKSIQDDWIEAMRPATAVSMQSELNEHELYTLDEVRRLLALPAKSLLEKRNRAAVAMLFLSGMRIGALVTLPVSCVDLENLKLYQLPSKGVKTKFHKAAVTSLLNIPDLLEVVREWDSRIRPVLPVDGYWYSLIGQQRAGDGVLRTDRGDGDPTERRRNFARHLKAMCEKAGIPYRRPHCLRHGHAVYGVKHAQNMQQLKAVSQNLMHGSISITDGLYGRLTADDVNKAITSLGSSPTPPAEMSVILQALVKLQQDPALLAKVIAA